MKPSNILAKNMKYLEDSGYVLPSSIAASIIFLAIILDLIFGSYRAQQKEFVLISIAFGGSIYILIQILLVVPRIQRYRRLYIWINAVISGLGLSILAVALDEAHHSFFDTLLILAVISISILSGRGPTYLLITVSEVSYILLHRISLIDYPDWTIHLIPLIASVVITETILQLRQATQDHIHRLETINMFSQQINSSLETKQVLTLLNATLQKAIAADSYYVGLADNGTIRLNLFYDDGEYFTDVAIPMDNTLSGWVIKNQSTLFLPDSRKKNAIADIQKNIIGKNKASLSWVGVPMKTEHINGLLAVASYKANTFTQTDMELLSNMAQLAALALDNTVHHKQVEMQSRLDSLTGTYNHRYFLKALQELIDTAYLEKRVISLIMLDIDFFKSYNDTFGHQVGDMVLTNLCETIQHNIKKGDFVGRWGGEEFVIALPGAEGNEAHQVAKRIQKTMQSLILSHPKYEKIPAPTVSQGISFFPDEANEIDRFIYLADQRLYKAKGRGRNQIEPDPSYWETIQTTKKIGATPE